MGKAFATLIITGVFLGLIYGMHYGFYELLSRQGVFSLKTIQVTGNSLVKTEDIIQNSGLVIGQDIFKTSLVSASHGILGSRLVESAVVTLLPPDRVEIKVKERQPAAVVNMKGQYFLCDKKGFIIEKGDFNPVLHLVIDYDAEVEDEQIKDEYLEAIMDNISGFSGRNEIKTVVVKKKEGVFMNVKGVEGTTFFFGSGIPEENGLLKMVSVAKKIQSEKLNVKYIDINKDNAIGFKEK